MALKIAEGNLRLHLLIGIIKGMALKLAEENLRLHLLIGILAHFLLSFTYLVYNCIQHTYMSAERHSIQLFINIFSSTKPQFGTLVNLTLLHKSLLCADFINFS